MISVLFALLGSADAVSYTHLVKPSNAMRIHPFFSSFPIIQYFRKEGNKLDLSTAMLYNNTDWIKKEAYHDSEHDGIWPR